MPNVPARTARPSVANLVAAMEAIAPLSLAASWDNVGLLVGWREARADRVMLTIDLTEPVLEEAIRANVGVIVAYHPPIFEAMKRLTDAQPRERLVLLAAKEGIAIYSPHTALDAAPDGINEWLAEGVGSGDARALRPHESLPTTEQFKIVTFAPAEAVEHIRQGLASVGAGRIGAYEQCSFELPGTGTFFGAAGANPAVGRPGRLERVREVRLEMVCGGDCLPLAMTALREFHPYEEPAVEVHELHARPMRDMGEGRRVMLDRGIPLTTLLARLKRRLGVRRIDVAEAQTPPAKYSTIGLCAGAGGSLLESAIAQGCHAFITGELRHHAVLDAQARGCTVLLAGHTNTERGYLPVLRDRLRSALPGTAISIATRDVDPLRAM